MATNEELSSLVDLMNRNRQALELQIAKQNVIVSAAVTLVEIAQADIRNSDQIDKALSDLVKAVGNRRTFTKPDENEKVNES